MTWKTFVNLPAIAPRRKVIATAIVYGLSWAVRFSSATGEEVEIPPQAVQSTSPVTSIVINDGAQLFNEDWPLAANRGWSPDSRGCRAACESPMAMPSCSSSP